MKGWNKIYSFTIGINKFENLSTLSCCENDALLFSQAIEKKLPKINSRIFLSNGDTEPPTSKNLNSLLKEIANLKLEENDIVFFNFQDMDLQEKEAII